MRNEVAVKRGGVPADASRSADLVLELGEGEGVDGRVELDRREAAVDEPVLRSRAY